MNGITTLKPKRDLLLLFLLNITCSACFFYPVLGKLNTVLMSIGGDGIKNYFCYLYYIRYDRGTHFTGMNYPFGENILFTDNMPLLAWSIIQLKTWFPGIADYGLVLMHSTFLISYFLCSFYLYKILRLFRVNGWWAVLSAVFIAYFSPQFFRLLAHFSLGLTCFFPMIIYWIMQYERSRKPKYLLYFFILTVLFTFLHVYYLAFTLVLTLAYSFAYCIGKHSSLLKKVKYVAPLLATAAVAVLPLKGYLLLTDKVTDRPANPYGYGGAAATGADILTSDYNFIGANAFAWLFGNTNSWTEGYAYIGLVTILVLLYLVFRTFKSFFLRLRKRKKVPAHPVRSYRVWLITASFLLPFSMGVPFIWGMDFLLDWIPVFKQFRSIGRFAWIFYYLSMIYAAIFLYRLFHYMRIRGYVKTRITLTILVIAMWAIEWNGYGQKLRAESSNAPANYLKFTAASGTEWPVWLKQKGYSSSYFQGLIGLPYTHIGSEKLGLQEDYNSVILCGAEIACATGLPMTDVMLSRTSWSQTFANLRLVDGALAHKPIVSRFNDKLFLVFVCPGIPLTTGEEELIQHAQYIGTKGTVKLYTLDMKAMVKEEERYADSLRKVVGSLPQQEGLLLPGTTAFRYSNHFDQYTDPHAFTGKGALPAPPEESKELVTIEVSHPANDSVFVCSAWFRCRMNLPQMPYLSFTQYDVQEKVVLQGDIQAAKSTYIIGDWFKAEGVMHIGRQVHKIKLEVHGGSKRFIAFDELLIYPKNSIYFYKGDQGRLFLNNRPVN